MAKEKKEVVTAVDLDDLMSKVDEISKTLDNPPVCMERGGFITGTISFGSLTLDLLTGGGVPPGKITDIYGPEGSSKSTLTYHITANAHRLGIPVFMLDHEAGLDGKYITSIGVKLRNADGTLNKLFKYYQPTDGDTSYRFMSRVMDILPPYVATDDGRPHPQAIFIVDSLAAMVPESVAENDENNQMALNAKVHSRGFPMLKTRLGRKNCSLVCVNQLRLRPGFTMGNPEYEPGGEAIKYYPDLKIRISAVGKPIEERGRVLRLLNIRTVKNKQFPPFLESEKEVAVAFGRGIDRGYDSLGFLKLTSQVEVKGGGNYHLSLPGTEWDGKSYKREGLMEVLHKNEMRSYLRSQLEDGSAFARFFDNLKMVDMYQADLEDAGTTNAATAEAEARLAAEEADGVEALAKAVKEASGKGEGGRVKPLTMNL